jgi:hypothetical protein
MGIKGNSGFIDNDQRFGSQSDFAKSALSREQHFLERTQGRGARSGAVPSAGLVFDLDARENVYTDSGTTEATNGSAIQQWVTVDGGTYTFEQTTTADKPVWFASSSNFNNQPYIRFRGAADSLSEHLIADYSSDFVLQDHSIFMVARNTNSGSNGSFDHFMMFGYSVDEGYHIYLDGATGNFGEYTAGNWTSDFVDFTQTSLQSYIYQARYEQSNNLKIRLDDLTEASDTAPASIDYTSTNSNTSGFILGAGFSSGSVTRELSCEITRLILYDRYLTDSERDEVRDILNTTYNTF